MPITTIPAAAEGVPAIIRTAFAGIVLAMTVTPAMCAERTGSVGLVSPAAFTERDDFSRADIVGWATSKMSKPDCLAEAQRLQRTGKATICFLD